VTETEAFDEVLAFGRQLREADLPDFEGDR
jgi:hypothetical protein